MSALFLKDLAAKTHRGIRVRVEKGRSGGGLCYGYDVVKRTDREGEPVRGDRRRLGRRDLTGVMLRAALRGEPWRPRRKD